jgi:hypothetical protein
VALKHSEAKPGKRSSEVVSGTSDSVNETIGVLTDVVREPFGVLEHHGVLHHFHN